MSKFGKELIESVREAREHAESNRNGAGPILLDYQAPHDNRRKTKPRGIQARLLRDSSLLVHHPRLRVHLVAVPNVRAIRRKLGVSQMEFAKRYRIPLPTLKNWEQGRRQPDAPASAYLQVIARRPREISEALKLPALPE